MAAAASGEAGEPEEKKVKKRDRYYDNNQDLPALAAKDDLTLMVRQLHSKTGEFDVFEAFSKAGQVVDVRLISDERSGKCQGVGYVEMADLQGATAALLLNGTMLCGQPIIVQPSLAEKNRLAAAGAALAETRATPTLPLPHPYPCPNPCPDACPIF